MSTDAAALVRTVDRLIERLSVLTSGDAAHGWTDESARGVRSRLNAFRDRIEALGSVPARADRPLNLSRALDHWGVDGGDLAEELAEFELELRR